MNVFKIILNSNIFNIFKVLLVNPLMLRFKIRIFGNYCPRYYPKNIYVNCQKILIVNSSVVKVDLLKNVFIQLTPRYYHIKLVLIALF